MNISALSGALDFFKPSAGVQKSQESQTPKEIEEIKRKGLRSYAEDLNRKKLVAMKRQEALSERGLDEEKLAGLKKKIPAEKYAELEGQIDAVMRDKLQEYIERQLAEAHTKEAKKDIERQSRGLLLSELV